MDSHIVVAGAVELGSQMPGHHVGAGRRAGALREGSCAGDQAQGCACPADDGHVRSPSLLHLMATKQRAGSLQSSGFGSLVPLN